MSLRIDQLANQLDWNLLLTFMVIVQERSITGAATRLNVTQPSVSAALRRLEERLNHRLVDRGAGQTFTVTRAGESVYREALEIYGSIVRLNHIVDQSDRTLTGNLVLHRSTHLDLDFLNPILADFQRKHPGVTYAVRSAPCYEVNQALLQRNCSIGFCTRVEASPRLRATALPSQPFGFYCGPRHPLFGVENPDGEALARSDLVGFEEDRMAGALSPVTIYRVRNAIGDRMIAVATEIVDLINLVRHGEAIGSVTIALAARYGPDLWRIPQTVAPPEAEIFAVIDADRHFTPAESALLDFFDANGLAVRSNQAEQR